MSERALPQIVEIRQHGVVTAVAALREDRDRYASVDATGRALVLHPARIVCWTGVPAPTEPDEVSAALRRYETSQAAAVADVDVQTLWELAGGEGDATTLQALASLLEPAADGATAARVLRALVADGVRFKVRSDDVLVLSAAQIETNRRAREEARRLAALRAAVIGWLQTGEGAPPEGGGFLLDGVRGLAAAPEQPPARDAGVALLKEAGLDASPHGAFELLVQRGVFGPHENLLRIRYGMDRLFSRSVLADAAARADGGWSSDGRLDLRDLRVISIDDEGTTEVDDALSVQRRPGGGVRGGGHRAEPGALIPAGCPGDREAARRCTTLYLAEGRRLMMPPAVAEGAASLRVGADRPALSVQIELDADGALVHSEVHRSVVRVTEAIPYGEVDRRLDADEDLAALSAAAEQLRAGRIESGAVETELTEVSPRVVHGDEVRLRVLAPGSPARRMVAEWMVRANQAAARACWQARVPTLYRHQELAPGAASPAELLTDRTDLFAAFRATRGLGHTLLDRVPRRHHGLGLDEYVQITSPLRRYMDLVLQRQLSAHLAGEAPPLDDDGLAEVAREVQPVLSRSRIVSAGSRDYWLCRWLQLHPDEVLDAVVLERQGRRVRVVIESLAWRLPLRPDRRLEEGERIRVVAERADPRAGRPRLKLST